LRAAVARSVLTTQKDCLNLCDGWQDLFAPLRVYWLRITMEVEGEDQLLDRVKAVITRHASVPRP
jgi:hypothetical protein